MGFVWNVVLCGMWFCVERDFVWNVVLCAMCFCVECGFVWNGVLCGMGFVWNGVFVEWVFVDSETAFIESLFFEDYKIRLHCWSGGKYTH